MAQIYEIFIRAAQCGCSVSPVSGGWYVGKNFLGDFGSYIKVKYTLRLLKSDNCDNKSFLAVKCCSLPHATV